MTEAEALAAAARLEGYWRGLGCSGVRVRVVRVEGGYLGRQDRFFELRSNLTGREQSGRVEIDWGRVRLAGPKKGGGDGSIWRSGRVKRG